MSRLVFVVGFLSQGAVGWRARGCFHASAQRWGMMAGHFWDLVPCQCSHRTHPRVARMRRRVSASQTWSALRPNEQEPRVDRK